MLRPDREVSVAIVSIVPLVLAVLSERVEVSLPVVVLVGEPSVSVAVALELPYGAIIVVGFVDMAVPITVIGTKPVVDNVGRPLMSGKDVKLSLNEAETSGDISSTDVVGAIVVLGSADSNVWLDVIIT